MVYSTQFIINLGGEEYQTEALKQRIRSKAENPDLNVHVLNLKPEDLAKTPTKEELELFAKVDNQSRIYILDHGFAHSQFIKSSHFEELGNYFGARLDKNKVNSNERSLNFSLLTCNSATGEENGFAGYFHRYMAQTHQIKAEVAGRTNFVIVNSKTPEYGKGTATSEYYHKLKKNEEIYCPAALHQISGSKLTYKWNASGNQIIVDSYCDKIRKKTNAFLREAHNILSVEQLETFKSSLEALKKITETEIMNADHAKDIVKHLTIIKDVLKSEKTQKYRKLLKQISSIIIKVDSTGLDSYKGRISSSKATDSYKTINKVIITEIYDKVNTALKKLPKGAADTPRRIKEQAFKQAVAKLLKSLGNISRIRAENLPNLSKILDELGSEISISKNLTDLIEIINSNDTIENKKKKIQEYVELLKSINIPLANNIPTKIFPEMGNLASLLKSCEESVMEYVYDGELTAAA